MSRQQRLITARKIRAWLAAGAVDRDVREGLTFVASRPRGRCSSKCPLFTDERGSLLLPWRVDDGVVLSLSDVLRCVSRPLLLKLVVKRAEMVA